MTDFLSFMVPVAWAHSQDRRRRSAGGRYVGGKEERDEGRQAERLHVAQ